MSIQTMKQTNRQTKTIYTSTSTCTAKSLTKGRRVWRFQLDAMLVFLSVTSIHFLFVFIHTFVLFFIHFFGIIFHCVLYISSITVIWIFYLEFAIPPPFRSRVLHLSFDIHENMKSIYWIMPSNKSSNKWQKKKSKQKKYNVISVEQLVLKIYMYVIDYRRKNPTKSKQDEVLAHFFCGRVSICHITFLFIEYS